MDRIITWSPTQGSVLGPLLFNVYLNDLFWFNEQTDVCNFANDTTLHSSDTELKNLVWRLENDSLIAMEWFGWNYMKLNEDKCHLLIAGNKHEHSWAKAATAMTRESHR